VGNTHRYVTVRQTHSYLTDWQVCDTQTDRQTGVRQADRQTDRCTTDRCTTHRQRATASSAQHIRIMRSYRSVSDAPRATSSRTHSTRPLFTASCSAVSFSWPGTSIIAPWSSSSVATATKPRLQASCCQTTIIIWVSEWAVFNVPTNTV